MTTLHLARGALAALIALVALARPGDARSRPAGSEGDAGHPPFPRQSPLVRRELSVTAGGRWIGDGVAYGPHRDGQRPGGPSPTRQELREDLRLMAPHWSSLRLYGAAEPSEAILQLIREEHPEMRVMLGVWIEPEERHDEATGEAERLPEAAADNRREIETAVRLAATYPGIVTSVCVGNETQVTWSSHRVPAGLLIGYLREMRARTSVPVSTADDFAYWKTAESAAIASEADFIVLHAHPLWNGVLLAKALDWTRAQVAAVRAAHPGMPVVLGETGWATRVGTEGDQGRLIKGAVGEEEQARFYRAERAWVEHEKLPAFFFEAFDENWKGGEGPDDVEKHWGLFRADRTPKAAMREEQ
jgi:exo-beta-1,3-glucanase (GH17 family)